MKQPIPRGQIVSSQRTVLVPEHIGDGHQQPIPRPVNHDSERRVLPEAGTAYHRSLIQNATVRLQRNHSDAAFEEGDDEAVVEIVPLGALAEPPFAVVGVDVSRAIRGLGVDDVSYGDGGEENEEEQKSGGAEREGHE